MFGYVYFYSAQNPIGSKGAELLSKADLPLLQKLDAGKQHIIKEDCKLNNVGVRNLAKANWPMLEIFWISKSNLIKIRTKWDAMDYVHS